MAVKLREKQLGGGRRSTCGVRDPMTTSSRGCSKLGANVRYVCQHGGDPRGGPGERAANGRDLARGGADRARRAGDDGRIRRPDAEQGAGAGRSSTARATHVRGRPRPRRGHARARPRRSPASGRSCARCRDGVDSLAASQAAGELPAVDVLPEQAGDGDEGTAMLEILHDMAPGAELGFATAFNSDASFADNIRALRFAAGCDVIVDDILYFNESPFEDGPIAQAVNDVTADGALYFSSAGNEGNTLDGTSGNYEGDFRGSGRTVGKFAGEAHDFDPGTGGAGVRADLARLRRRRAGHAVLGEPARRGRRRLRPVPVQRRRQGRRLRAGRRRTATTIRTRSWSRRRRRERAAARGRALHAAQPRYFQLSALRGRFEAAGGAAGLGDARRDARALRGRGGVQHRRRAGRGAAAVRRSSRATRRTRPGRSPARSPPPSCRSGSPPTARGACSSRPRRSRGRSRTSPPPTASTRRSPDFKPFFGTSRRRPARGRDRRRCPVRQPGRDGAEVREAFNATALDLVPAGRGRAHRRGHPARRQRAGLHGRDAAAAGARRRRRT